MIFYFQGLRRWTVKRAVNYPILQYFQMDIINHAYYQRRSLINKNGLCKNGLGLCSSEVSGIEFKI